VHGSEPVSVMAGAPGSDLFSLSDRILVLSALDKKMIGIDRDIREKKCSPHF